MGRRAVLPATTVRVSSEKPLAPLLRRGERIPRSESGLIFPQKIVSRLTPAATRLRFKGLTGEISDRGILSPRRGSGERGFSLPTANRQSTAFTLLEVMIAIMIFAMVLTAIYATWIAILRGTKSGTTAAAEVQRSRIAIRTLEDAFLSAVMFTENSKYYYFSADNSRDMAGVSMVSRLPASFPGVGRYGDQVVRRVNFSTQPGKDRGQELVMSQAPMLLDTTSPSVTPYSLVLAKDVSLFTLEFWDMRQNDWVTEWINTNQLPRLVRISLGLGKVAGNASKPQDLVTRVVALPAISVAGVQAGPGPGFPGGQGILGQPGYQPGQSGQPGQPGYQPGQPGYQPGQPGYQPGQPGYQPGQRGYQPGQPGYGGTPNPGFPNPNPGRRR